MKRLTFTPSILMMCLTLIACGSMVLADDQELSTPEEFREMGDLALGRWVGDIKFIADWPGQDLGKGERVVGYAQYSWAADKKALLCNGVAGNVSNTSIFAWDPVSKQIKLFDVATSGSVAELVIWKKAAGVFGWRYIAGGEVDGRAHSGSGEWVFAEDGKTMTIRGQTTLGGEKNDPLKDVYKRLSPTE